MQSYQGSSFFQDVPFFVSDNYFYIYPNADNDDIELVSNNYNGERYRSLTKVQKISSSFYRDRYDAEEEIKTMAKYLGCTHIVNLRWRSDTGEEEGPKGGTHIYTVWQAIGYAAK